MIRVVFDTNILFSGFGWRGSPYQCLQLTRENRIISITCKEILTELEEKLPRKMGLSIEDSKRAIAEILIFSEVVEISGTLKVIEADVDDDAIVECAVVGKADYIVSGDRHLLNLGSYQNIQVLRAAEFIAVVAQQLL